MYKTPVSIVDNPKINQWLSMVEKEMRLNLATLLAQAVDDIAKFSTGSIDTEQYIEWVDRYQAQLVVLASQITWSTGVEGALQTLQSSPTADLTPLQDVLKVIEATLNVLADSVLHEQPPVRRKKLEHLVRNLIHNTETSMVIATSFDCRSSFTFSFSALALADHRAGTSEGHYQDAHH